MTLLENDLEMSVFPIVTHQREKLNNSKADSSVQAADAGGFFPLLFVGDYVTVDINHLPQCIVANHSLSATNERGVISLFHCCSK